jgi:hypothetical protein
MLNFHNLEARRYSISSSQRLSARCRSRRFIFKQADHQCCEASRSSAELAAAVPDLPFAISLASQTLYYWWLDLKEGTEKGVSEGKPLSNAMACAKRHPSF